MFPKEVADQESDPLKPLRATLDRIGELVQLMVGTGAVPG
jgi:hypothetical protein